ncbi:ABC transporter permease subunit [Nocardioides sambongensis]|uniref:ABC transporter permease subunit n=1 Tax=Nocardioides sambongensis TaxID=2589074 RepID=UPI00112AB686|nr:ABC transporter permease subunit [Nocardioides sambongensis]
MRSALLAEYRKLVTTRVWWLLLLAMAGYLVFIAAVMSASFALAPSGEAGVPAGESAAATTYSLVNSIGYVFPLVIGSLAMTTEFRHRTITQSLLVEPDRTRFLVAKVLSVVPVGLVAGVVGVAAVVLGGAPLLALQGDGAYLGDPDVLTGLALGVLAIALWAMIGVGFGSLVPNQVAAIVVILAFTQFVEPIARLGLGQVDALERLAYLLPGGAADSLIGASLFADMGGGDLLPRWAAALVLLGYAVGFAVLGRLTTLRRDIG